MQGNRPEKESDEINLHHGSKQVTILSGDQCPWDDFVFYNGKIDVAKAVYCALGANGTILFLGEHDCALSLGILTALQEAHQQANISRQLDVPDFPSEDTTTANEHQKRRWHGDSKESAYPQFLDFAKDTRPCNSIHRQAARAASTRMRARPTIEPERCVDFGIVSRSKS